MQACLRAEMKSHTKRDAGDNASGWQPQNLDDDAEGQFLINT